MNSTFCAHERNAIFSDWHRVSVFSLRFSYVDGALEIHWHPRWPQGDLERAITIPRYRDAMRRFFGSLLESGVRRIGVFDLVEVTEA